VLINVWVTKNYISQKSYNLQTRCTFLRGSESTMALLASHDMIELTSIKHWTDVAWPLAAYCLVRGPIVAVGMNEPIVVQQIWAFVHIVSWVERVLLARAMHIISYFLGLCVDCPLRVNSSCRSWSGPQHFKSADRQQEIRYGCRPNPAAARHSPSKPL
jgi:hypothetical protein